MPAASMDGSYKLGTAHGTGYRASLALQSLAACQLGSSLISTHTTEADMPTLETPTLGGC